MKQDIHKYYKHPNLDYLGHTHLDAILKLTRDNTDLPVDPVLRTEEVDILVAAVAAVLYHRRMSVPPRASTFDLEAVPPVPDSLQSLVATKSLVANLRNPSRPSTI
jgi:hypothetical protein